MEMLWMITKIILAIIVVSNVALICLFAVAAWRNDP